ncbi:MAG TPA: hypothetical protein VGI52_08245 [Solirubrobacteraceae bacterium]
MNAENRGTLLRYELGIGWGGGSVKPPWDGGPGLVEPALNETNAVKGDVGDMRHVKMIVGVVVAAVALTAFAGPAFAKVEEKHFYGEFTASKLGKTISPESPAVAKGTGEVEELKIAGVPVECEGFKGKAEAIAERSTSLKMTLIFKKCAHFVKQGPVISEQKVTFKKPLVLMFHANGSARVVTIEKNEAELKINPAKCKYHIPEQEIPLSAENKPESEFETAEYATEEESVSSKKFPSGIRDRLDVTMVLKHILTTFKPTGPHCEYVHGEEAKFNPETEEVETSSKFEAEVEEITLPGGSIGFDTEEA